MGDAAQCTALARAAKATWGYPPEWMELWCDDLTIAPAYIGEHHVIVAESIGDACVVVGMGALEDHGDVWHIEHLWVAPHSQRQGLGRALIGELLAAARERPPGAAIRLEADPNAADFYRRLGAVETGGRAAPMPGAPNRVLVTFELPAAV